MFEDFDRCWRAVRSKDARFDGWFVTAVTTTRIYCRPSCPVVPPKPANVRFYPTAAAAQVAGFRACKRCRPDAAPGSPEWNARADLVGRAMRLVADGLVDREGVSGLARRLACSERHLNRQLSAEVGAGPIALARAQRAHTSRVLIETTDLSFTEVAFAAGFGSIRQFNDTVRKVFGTTPTELRVRRRLRGVASPGVVTLRLPYRGAFAAEGLLEFLSMRAVPGVEEVAGGVYRRSVALPRGAAIIELGPAGGHVACTLRLQDVRDLGTAVQRCRRLFDLDADPEAVDQALGDDPILARSVKRNPGLRLPGTMDGAELALRAVIGEQLSIRAAQDMAGRLVLEFGRRAPTPVGTVTHLFPTPDAIASADPSHLLMPASRRRALQSLATALASGEVVIHPGVERGALAAQLRLLPGISSWTANYVAMRALGDPDVFLATDLRVRRALASDGHPVDPSSAARLAERWRPWRAYAVMHLWADQLLGGRNGRPDPPLRGQEPVPPAPGLRGSRRSAPAAPPN